MKLSEASKAYVFTTRIELDDKKNFIVLKEPSMKQLDLIQSAKEDQSKIFEVLQSILPDCIVDSSFTNDSGEPSTGQEIAAMLKEMSSLEAEIINTWINSIPFQNRLPKKGKK
jgi:hypothetical protein